LLRHPARAGHPHSVWRWSKSRAWIVRAVAKHPVRGAQHLGQHCVLTLRARGTRSIPSKGDLEKPLRSRDVRVRNVAIVQFGRLEMLVRRNLQITQLRLRLR